MAPVIYRVNLLWFVKKIATKLNEVIMSNEKQHKDVI